MACRYFSVSLTFTACLREPAGPILTGHVEVVRIPRQRIGRPIRQRPIQPSCINSGFAVEALRIAEPSLAGIFLEGIVAALQDTPLPCGFSITAAGSAGPYFHPIVVARIRVAIPGRSSNQPSWDSRGSEGKR